MKPIKKIDKSDLIPDDSGSVELLGFPIHWERYGSGPQIVLLIPGALGTAKSDFYQQLRGPLAFDLNRYTFIAVELPGWGQSRPPKRPYGIDVYDTDVKCCLQLMEHLNYNSYSVLGWSDGAKVAILCAILQPVRVQAVAASGIFVFGNKNNILPFLKTQKIDTWDAELRQNYEEIYGYELLQQLWDNHVNWCKDFQGRIAAIHAQKPELKEIRFAIHNDLMNGLGKIRCPVLIIHGDKDPLCGLEQPLYCQERIANCTLRRFPDASHNVHMTHTEEFRRLVDQFFSDNEDFY
ncbi:Abhydrolase-like protein [Sarcoptes scabiei]|uniref:Abhydrolase-like protein n=1 Tax=Sarcoptes scabiei TaxID=52283 RepID=A0A131ZYM3_SARSC|nr:Abhydrolase-like protein [Sarcoptes scabiei]